MTKVGWEILLFALITIVIAPVHCDGAPANTNEAARFQAMIQKLHDAIATGDKSVWKRVLAPDFIMTDEDGKILDRRQFLASLIPLPRGFSGVQAIKRLTIRQWGSAAVVHFWVYERENAYGQVLKTTYVETDTFHHQADTWEMVAAQVTVVPRNFKPVRINTQSWPALEGKYGLSGRSSSPYEVFSRDGMLYGGRDRKSATRLIPLSPLVYYQKGTIHIMVFVKDAEGAVNEVLQLHKYNEVVLKRIPQERDK